jgi:20S proteasome alpha/beta subunit
MTIGIGFLCHDGIVLATDTQYTRGVYKGHGPKIFPLFAPPDRSDLVAVIAGAGRVAYMQRCAEKIKGALATSSNPTQKDLQGIIENELLAFYQRYIYPSPNPDRSAFELIIGAWTGADKAYSLFKTEDIVVTSVASPGKSSYCTIGSGFSVADYALGLTYDESKSVADATFLAAFCVKAAKDYVDYCGGNTHIYTIRNSPYRVHHLPDVIVKEAESISVELFDLLKLILNCLNPEALWDEEAVRTMTDSLKDSIMNFRSSQLDRILGRNKRGTQAKS